MKIGNYINISMLEAACPVQRKRLCSQPTEGGGNLGCACRNKMKTFTYYKNFEITLRNLSYVKEY